MLTKKQLISAAPIEAALSFNVDSSAETIQQALAEAKNLLSVVTDNPLLEAEMLLAHVLDTTRSYLYKWCDTKLNEDQ